MQSIVLYSPADPALLVKAYEMLKEKGYPDDCRWNSKYMKVGEKKQLDTSYINGMCFFNFPPDKEEYEKGQVITLTPENLEQSVRTVLDTIKNK